jgi:1,2-beta-oligoglucan phosphorylase
MNIKNQSGLTVEFLENGSIKSFEADPIRISLKETTPFSKPGANIYLRKNAKPFEFATLLGPESNSRFKVSDAAFIAGGTRKGIEYSCSLRLSQKSMSWQFTIEIKNKADEQLELDLIYVQDIGLKPINSGLINEYYVSQYLERRILEDQTFGSVICCRQNMKEEVGNPWFMMACKNGAVAGSTDGMQFYGRTYRETGIPNGLLVDNAGGEYAGESSVVALQEKPFKLAAGESYTSVFIATYLQDHPDATSEDDLSRLSVLKAEFDNEILSSAPGEWFEPEKNIFNTSTFFPVEDLSNEELNIFFGKERRHQEEENGRLLSFFSKENNHVVLKEKETVVDRPHGHIMQAKAGLVPDENIVSTTTFMFGVFNSHLTQGNTNFNTLLSICTSQFNLSPESGQRIFVEINGKMYLLGVPSAFEIGLNHCRWIYKHGNHCFQVRTWTSKSAPQVNMDFKVLSDDDVRLIIIHDFDGLNGWKIFSGNKNDEYFFRPKPDSMIAGKFPNAQFRMKVQSEYADFRACGDAVLYAGNKSLSDSKFVLDVRKTSAFCLSFLGELCYEAEMIQFENADEQWLSDCIDAGFAWQDMSLNLSLEGQQEDVAAIREILPWYGMNALTHLLTPYGLEQFSGAAWGTRDVAQGPVELLLCLQKYDEAKQVLHIIFSNQNPDGGWPQWWMFDSYHNIRANDSHGDVVYWCIIALASYIKVTGDSGILDEVLPYYHQNGINAAEKSTLNEHMHRLINMITASFIPGTALVPFGGGDWNDSLQPVSEELAQRMISSWTVEMNYQAFREYQQVFLRTGQTEKAGELAQICEKIKSDFNKYLVKDGVVAGYGLVEKNGEISVLLHPSDTTTGISYSILPMERGILSEIFTKEQALHHQNLIEKHLKGPDGARLMDRPLKYKGGIQTIFQRAESSTFFGREIGLMYMHEHIRYAESLARTGKADAFVKALRQAIPVAYRNIVSCGDIRQANCYYSSSDVAFKSRYEADELYDKIMTGNVTLRGGWRVYSSGPGIYIGMIISKLLGLRVESDHVILDPVMPFAFSGLSVSMKFLSHEVTFRYIIEKGNHSPQSVFINKRPVEFIKEANPYRDGGAKIRKDVFMRMMDQASNVIEITL